MEHTLHLNGEEIACREQGAGAAVMLVHSLGTSGRLWDGTVAALAGQFRVIAIDCRGHGGSSNRGGFTLEAIAADVLAAASALGVTRFHYVGISMGGLFGVVLNSIAPERLLSLTLADSYDTVGAAGPPRLAATRAALATTLLRDFAAAYVNETLMPGAAPALCQQTIDAIAGMTVENYLQTLEAILTADVSPLLSAIAVPTLVMVGANDRRTPVAVAERLAGTIAGARLVVVPEAGHLAVLDQPEFFNAALLEFLQSAAPL